MKESILSAESAAAAAAFFLETDALDGHAAPDAAIAETAATRARACLVAASQEDDATEALRWLERALHAAERTRRPLTLTVTSSGRTPARSNFNNQPSRV